MFTLVFIVLAAVLFGLACVLRTLLHFRKLRVGVNPFEALESTAGDNSHSNLAESATTSNGTNDESPATVAAAEKRLSLARRSAISPVRVTSTHRVSGWKAFRRRLTHSWLILLTIFYLRMITLQLKVSSSYEMRIDAPIQTPITSL